jgi:hypothetical protein
MKKRTKILIAPVEIAGYYSNLAKGFKELGVDYDFVVYSSHTFGYGGESKKPILLRLADWFNQLRSEKSIFLVKVISIIPMRFLTYLWGTMAMFRYNVFVFAFGRSLLPNNIDLPILKFLGKRVISNLSHGSEARPPYIDGSYLSKEGDLSSISEIFSLVLRNKNIITRHQKYADLVIGAPYSSSQFAKNTFINYLNLGIPISYNHSEKDSFSQVHIQGEIPEKKIRILHSPSNPVSKGTSQITKAIENLKSKGYLIDFVLIQNRPFHEVLLEIKRCDFVVDQLFSDTPMAGFATEAAWFGKPAVVGGYGLDKLKKFVPDDMWPPSKISHPDHIEQAIEYLLTSKDNREKLGKQAQTFVKEKWNAIEVAKKYLCLIKGEIPLGWTVNPLDIEYLEGVGQSVTRTRLTVRELISAYGVDALQLGHRPELEALFVKFADEKI